MKLVVTFLFCIAVLSCKESTRKIKNEVEQPAMTLKYDDSKFPEAMRKIFEAHGEWTKWKTV